MSKRTRLSASSVANATPSAPPKRGKAAFPSCDQCPGCDARAKMLAEKETQLQALEEQLEARQEELAEKEAELHALEEQLEARERLLDADREKPTSLRRREGKLLAKLEERMRLALALNELPRERERGEDARDQLETIRDALARLGKSYEHYNDGNGVLVAAQLYGSVERFLALFPVGVKLGVVTPVARLLGALAHGKFELGEQNEDDDGTEEVEPRDKEDVAKSLLRAFGRRVDTRDNMRRVCDWLTERKNLAKLTEEELRTLVYEAVIHEDDEEEEEEEQHREPFEPPPPRNLDGTSITLRNDELYKKIKVAQELERHPDSKEALEAKHSAYMMRIGKALAGAAWLYHLRGNQGHNDHGIGFFLKLFSTGTAKRKHADLGTVERTAVLINALDEDVKQRFAAIVDLPEQMARVSELATSKAVDLVRCRVVKNKTLRRLARLLDEFEASKARDTAIYYLKRHVNRDFPRLKYAPAEVIDLLQAQVGDFILTALSELACHERKEQHDQDKLVEALQAFDDFVEELERETTKKNPIPPDQRDALIIALMLLWKGHKVINEAGAGLHMLSVCDSLKKLGFPRKTIAHPDTGDDQNLFDWPSAKDGQVSDEF